MMKQWRENLCLKRSRGYLQTQIWKKYFKKKRLIVVLKKNTWGSGGAIIPAAEYNSRIQEEYADAKVEEDYSTRAQYIDEIEPKEEEPQTLENNNFDQSVKAEYASVSEEDVVKEEAGVEPKEEAT
ncbi:hypothetical protein TWF481_010641 [Arthrobotrys musiformis]|uniref:Uncharacterized protein n=1 Tax=Arthrobotrys musiformis TaxID=47236 RepID=A0AAV9W1H9_9PEZI